MSRRRLRWGLVLAVLVVGCCSGQASAQTDGWSFLVTPQLWLTHIDKNGFAPPTGLGGTVIRNSADVVTEANPIVAGTGEPVDTVYPQWGIQFAAQKGRLTLAAAFQRVEFETRTDIVAGATPFQPLVCGFFNNCSAGSVVQPGQFLGRERLRSERMDVDLAASYAFPDVVPGLLDVSAGLGVKAIYAEATRRTEDLGVELTFQNFFLDGLYFVSSTDDFRPGTFRFKQTVRVTDWLYGLTIPTNMTLHLGDRWLVPVSLTPFFGGETRDDHDVVYRQRQTGPTTVVAERLDGTKFAVGVTADVTLRYLVNDALSVYAGGRVQYIKGLEQFLAYGPIVGMSVRFGGK